MLVLNYTLYLLRQSHLEFVNVLYNVCTKLGLIWLADFRGVSQTLPRPTAAAYHNLILVYNMSFALGHVNQRGSDWLTAYSLNLQLLVRSARSAKWQELVGHTALVRGPLFAKNFCQVNLLLCCFGIIEGAQQQHRRDGAVSTSQRE